MGRTRYENAIQQEAHIRHANGTCPHCGADQPQARRIAQVEDAKEQEAAASKANGMSDNVINLPVITTFDLPAERVLQEALNADLDGVVVIGYAKDGTAYMASSIAGGPEVNWLLDRCKARMMSFDDGED